MLVPSVTYSTSSTQALLPTQNSRPAPFIKWAGGKRRLLSNILARFPNSFGTYREPFLGGGAVFFGLSPTRAVLSDINPELTNAFAALRDDAHGVIGCLQRYVPTAANFYRVRAQQPIGLTSTEAAARLIFLNRTCFNGLYRVNRRGEFNVPFGKRVNPTICNVPKLLAASRALRDADIRTQCVFDAEESIEPGDLVYLDPPYDPVSGTSSFTKYTRQGFDRDDQVRLAKLFARLADRGVHVVLSNAATPFVQSLYRGHRIDVVTTNRVINSRAERRGPIGELLISTSSPRGGEACAA